MLQIFTFEQSKWIAITGIIVIIGALLSMESYSVSTNSFVSLVWDKFEYTVNEEAELTMIISNSTKNHLFVNVTSLNSPQGISMKLNETGESSGIFKGKIKFVEFVTDETKELAVWKSGDTITVDYLGTKMKVTIIGQTHYTTSNSTLTLIKVVNGSSAEPDDFGLSVNEEVVKSGEIIHYPANVPLEINEVGLSGYNFTSITGIRCPDTLGGTITLEEDDQITCIITNTFVVPSSPTLTLIKIVNGSSADLDDFGISVNGTVVTSGKVTHYPANLPLEINEAGLSGYNFTSITGDAKCPVNLGETITLAEDDQITCIITNTFFPEMGLPTLTLVKQVKGGYTADLDGFGISVNGNVVKSGEPIHYPANLPLEIKEMSNSGFELISILGDKKCPKNLGGTIFLSQGDDIKCIITYDKVAPVSLTLVKLVSGSSQKDTGFYLKVNGTEVLSKEPNFFAANSMLFLDEIPQSEYSFKGITGIGCPKNFGQSFKLMQDTVCTINYTKVSSLDPLLVIIITIPLGAVATFIMHNQYGKKTKAISSNFNSKTSTAVSSHQTSSQTSSHQTSSQTSSQTASQTSSHQASSQTSSPPIIPLSKTLDVDVNIDIRVELE